ncbi:selenoneine biosynthesis selenosugar synthase SenB [Methylobacterium sp. NEAU K]|uniref:selenoneine biosynthesis selenosugar synthase SenB n=1 Tax=Methylobacterium sp. NEAU K TaxID=3064946 RepID=UPI002734B757|nr:selenoneine biosynthesis selenosugar synthase SenB [Methylobacterium sp. NEAU K]MDP4005945.1 selenoneine biosynthesis selenosugar synthase SenB [Methylobacterium sp. NEAU K]
MRIVLVTPAAATRRTGNRATATRWAGFLRELGHVVEICTAWDGQPADLMIALHAWRSAASIARFRIAHPDRPLAVALTGTDLYHYLDAEPVPTLHSLDLADQLIGLHDRVGEALPERHRGKLRVIHQSARGRAERAPPNEACFEVLVVGHLRAEKDPFRAALAAQRLPADSRSRVVHLGAASDPAWAEAARAEMEGNPRYEWLGDRPPALVRRFMARARLMVLSSHMEGGANVISEALVSGLPVLASRIVGSVGLLGPDYPGYVSVGDTAGLADLMLRAERDPNFLRDLGTACAARADLFRPAHEKARLGRLVAELARDQPLLASKRALFSALGG